MFSDTIVSFIRTYVPIIVGTLATWLLTLGVEIDSSALTGVLVSVVTAVYYGVARLLERKYPKFGWLLGRPAEPAYPTQK